MECLPSRGKSAGTYKNARIPAACAFQILPSLFGLSAIHTSAVCTPMTLLVDPYQDVHQYDLRPSILGPRPSRILFSA